MELVYECEVCHLPMDRERNHYGGQSCYSCRSFFRRITKKAFVAKCQFKQKCKISYFERKGCTPCRFQKCLRAGMRSAFVLSEEEKSKRFRKYGRESDELSESNGDEDVAKSGNVVKRLATDDKKKKKIKVDNKREDIGSDPTDAPGPSNLNFLKDSQTCGTFATILQESDSELDDLWLMSLADVSDESNEEFKEEGFLDAETGLLIKPSVEIDKYVKSPTDNEKYRFDQFPKNPLHLQHEEKRKRSIADENLILEYVHKKFGVATVHEQRLLTGGQQLTGTATEAVEMKKPILTLDHQVHHNPANKKRTTVIVLNLPKTENVENIEEKVYESLDIDFVCSLTIQEIENMYTLEEEAYFKNIIITFDTAWKSVCFGPEIMDFYIGFCKKPRALPSNYFRQNHSVWRKRLLSCICSTEDMQALSTRSRYNLLKRNLAVTELFTNIAAVNFMKNEELMIEFVLGDSDLLQWKERSEGNNCSTLEEVMSNIPWPDSCRRALGNALTFNFKPVLCDPNVLPLVFMIIILAQDAAAPAPEVSSILSQYWMKLTRYLANTMGGNVQEEISYLMSSMEILPSLIKDHSEGWEQLL